MGRLPVRPFAPLAGGRAGAYNPGMLLPALLALSLVAGQADEDPWDEEDVDRGADTGVYVVAWGGSALATNGGGSHAVYGGEAGWSFESVDLGIAGSAFRDLGEDGDDGFDPMILARFGQRFQTYRGLEGALNLGLGAARTDKWRSWVQLGLGVRLAIDPLFAAGEITFEQNGLIRLSGGLGVRF